MDCRGTPDRELVKLCLQKNEEAWTELVRRFQPLIAGVISKTLRRWSAPDRSVIDELVQDSFLKLCAENFKALRKFDWPHENALPGFLIGVASNVAQDYGRREHAIKRGSGKEEESIEDVQPEVVTPDPFTGQVEPHLVLDKTVRDLESYGDKRVCRPNERSLGVAMVNWDPTPLDVWSPFP